MLVSKAGMDRGFLDALAMARREVRVSFARFNAEAGLGGFQVHPDTSSDVNVSAH